MMENKVNKPKIDPNLAKAQLWRIGNLSWKLRDHQKDLYELFYNSKEKINTWLLARRCLAEGTMVKTPTGLKAIEDMKVGDEVFGYNMDGTISIAKVRRVFYNGEKEVVDLTNNGRVIETCTLDHVWLTQNSYDGKIVERKTKDIKSHHKIVRKEPTLDFEIGKNVEHAYALGALLGDGCSRERGFKICISSENEEIPKNVAKILNAKFHKQSGSNFTWTISYSDKMKYAGDNKNRVNLPVYCEFYNEWCKNKYAHEKIIDLNEIKTWNINSQLALLAGLLDTDGSFTICENNLILRFSMQSKSCIEAIQYIIHSVFQYKPKLLVDNRSKYKNGPCYTLVIKHNYFVSKILKTIAKFQACDRKMWKEDYNRYVSNNFTPEFLGIRLKNKRVMKTYDINIDNETNLYLTANGLVTHNSGKTYVLSILAIEACIKQPNVIVKFVAPTKSQVNQILRPIIRDILADCPQDLKPELKTQDWVYYFPNGSEIQLAGSEAGHYNRLRGGSSWIAIVDEAQDVTDLDEVIGSVLLPTTLTTRGKIILAGTPPNNADHDFIKYVEKAELTGTLIRKTVYDNKSLSKEDIEMLENELGGKDSEKFRRELLCEVIKDPTTSVIPEFTKELKAKVVKEWVKPPFYTSYVGMDLGFDDLTVVLFAYYDFRNDKIVIEDEFVINGVDLHLDKLSNTILDIEYKLWTNQLTNETTKPHVRVSDIQPIVINEITRLSNYQLMWQNADKRDKDASINFLRMMLYQEKIVIHPRCTTLVRHLENVRWASKNNHETFARSADDGHYDAVDALRYLIRAVDYKKNPYPSNYNMSGDRFTNPYQYKPNIPNGNNKNLDVFKKIFGRK